MVIIAVFPGQGSQTPGFLEPWLHLEGSRERLGEYSEWAGIDLIAAGTEWDADRIRNTQVAQPLIVAASLLSWGALADRGGFAGVAGHSVGEFAAAAAAGVLSEEDALRLVGIRGRAMAEAAAVEQTGMSAIIGGDEAVNVARLAELDLTPANYNGGGQLVAAGALEALDALAAQPPAGTRVIPLQVAGAFHTRYMGPAVDALRQAAATIAPADPARTIWSNRDGASVASGSEFLDLTRRPGRLSSPLGPVHGVLRRRERRRNRRTLTRGNSHRPRQARAARRSERRSEDARRPACRTGAAQRRRSMSSDDA